MPYAEGTTVSVEQSRAEIERTLTRYGADAFGYGIDGPEAKVAFRLAGRYYRFRLTLPDPQSKAFWEYKKGFTTYRRTDAEGVKRYEQACRQKWRAMLLVIKAKLEAVDAGISTVEDEFLASMILPDAQTVGEWLKPQIEEAYRVGAMPKHLMLGGPG
jgi:hypothetical protein